MFLSLISSFIIIITIITMLSGFIALPWLIIGGEWSVALRGIGIGILGGYILKMLLGFVGLIFAYLISKATQTGRKYQTLFWIILSNTISFITIFFWTSYIAEFYIGRLYGDMTIAACLATLSTATGIFSSSNADGNIPEILAAFSTATGLILGSLYLLLTQPDYAAVLMFFIIVALEVGLFISIYISYQTIKEKSITPQENTGFFGTEMFFAFLNVILLLILIWSAFSHTMEIISLF